MFGKIRFLKKQKLIEKIGPKFTPGKPLRNRNLGPALIQGDFKSLSKAITAVFLLFQRIQRTIRIFELFCYPPLFLNKHKKSLHFIFFFFILTFFITFNNLQTSPSSFLCFFTFPVIGRSSPTERPWTTWEYI